jgi:HJR/Mrr/RecB family endonuclease
MRLPMVSEDSPSHSDADDDTFTAIIGSNQLSLSQKLHVSSQTTIGDKEFRSHIRSVLRDVDPLGLRIVMHMGYRPKRSDKYIAKALQIPVEFVTECRLRITQKMVTPITGAMVAALQGAPAPMSALGAIQRFATVNTVVDREIRRFFPIAEGVVGIQDMARARGVTLDELARQALSEASADDQGGFDILVPKPIEEIDQLRPELLDRLRSRVDDLQRIKPSVVEQIIAELLASRGFHYVCWVGRNPRTSADIIAAKYTEGGRERVYFIEVKRSKERVGVQVIDHVYGAMLAERKRMGWHAVMVVSTYGFASFRKYSRDYLRSMRVYLKDRDDLVRWLSEYRPKGSGLWLPPNL